MDLHAIDSHTEGEPTRVLVGGVPDLGPGPVARRAEVFSREHDDLRRALVCEPRGHDVLVGALLLPAGNDDVDAGVIFFNNVGMLGMCVHGTIGVVRTLAHLGRVPTDPGTTVRLETPVGVVAATLGEAGLISVENVASHRSHRGLEIDLGDRVVHADVAWGGNWFALVSDHGERLGIERRLELTDLCWRIRHGVNRVLADLPDAPRVDHVELFAPGDGDVDSRNFVLCPGGAYDRSPCGTGTSAKLACLAADGELDEGRPWVQESIIGTRFVGRWRSGPDLGVGEVVPHIAGRAWITGTIRPVRAADDPFRDGLSSTPRPDSAIRPDAEGSTDHAS